MLLAAIALIVFVPWLVDQRRCLFVAEQGLVCRGAPGASDLDATSAEGSGAADLAYGIFRGAALDGRDLSHRQMQYVVLRGASLVGADLGSSDLQYALASDANLQGARVAGADVQRADLRRSNLRGADLSGANLSGALLADADLSDATLAGAVLHDVDLSGVRGLTVAQLAVADLGATTVPPDVADDCPEAPTPACPEPPTWPGPPPATDAGTARDALLDAVEAFNLASSEYYDHFAPTMRCWYRARTMPDDPRRTDKDEAVRREGPRARNLTSTFVVERLTEFEPAADGTSWFQVEGTHYQDDGARRTSVRNVYRLSQYLEGWLIDVELGWDADAERRCVLDVPGPSDTRDVHAWVRSLAWQGDAPDPLAPGPDLERRSSVLEDTPPWAFPKGTRATPGYVCDEAASCLVVLANVCSRGAAQSLLDTFPTEHPAWVVQASRTAQVAPPAPCDFFVALGPFDGPGADAAAAGLLERGAPVRSDAPQVLDVRGWCNAARPVHHATFGTALVCGETAE